MVAISRDGKLPLYQQIYEILRGNILSLVWKPGDMLPAESVLAERYRVSTITVRQALEILEQEGLIYRQRGRGTFVAKPTLAQNLSRIISFTEDMHRRGCTPKTEIISLGMAAAIDEIAEMLKVKNGEELARIERLRIADDEPMSVEESFVVSRYCLGLLNHDFSLHPLREILDKAYGIHLVRARQTIRAVPASPYMAHHLSVKSHAALLLIERVSYSQHDFPVEFLRIYYRGDRYTLHNELQG